jgi:uncharacterized protein (UPF0276 family)
MTEMSEIQFIQSVLTEADCDLHLDVNNVYVNSINHNYDPIEFIRSMPTERIVYRHMAGHYQEDENLVIDTHGEDVIEPVWSLLDESYRLHGVSPTLLERDFNIPSLDQLMIEVKRIAQNQARYSQVRDVGIS